NRDHQHLHSFPTRRFSDLEFAHGFTYSGHPVAAAVALANLRLLRDEGIVERVRTQTAPYLQRRWRELAEHPLVGEARGIGMVARSEEHTSELQSRENLVCR